MERLRHALALTRAAKSARFAETVSRGPGAPADGERTAEGVAELDSQRVRARQSRSGAMAEDVVADLRASNPLSRLLRRGLIGLARSQRGVYEAYYDGGARFDLEDGGQKWRRVSRRPPAAGAPRYSTDPMVALDLLGAIATAEPDGHEDVRDSRAERFRVMLEPARIAPQLPHTFRKHARGRGEPVQLPAFVWVDGGGLIRRISWSPAAASAVPEGTRVWKAVDLWDFGAALEVPSGVGPSDSRS